MANTKELEKRLLEINSQILESLEPEPKPKELPEFCQLLENAYDALKKAQPLEDKNKQRTVAKKFTSDILRFWTYQSVMYEGCRVTQNIKDDPSNFRTTLEVEEGLHVVVWSRDHENSDEQILTIAFRTEEDWGQMEFIRPPVYMKNPKNIYKIKIDYHVGKGKDENGSRNWDRMYEVEIEKGMLTKIDKIISSLRTDKEPASAIRSFEKVTVDIY